MAYAKPVDKYYPPLLLIYCNLALILPTCVYTHTHTHTHTHTDLILKSISKNKQANPL